MAVDGTGTLEYEGSEGCGGFLDEASGGKTRTPAEMAGFGAASFCGETLLRTLGLGMGGVTLEE